MIRTVVKRVLNKVLPPQAVDALRASYWKVRNAIPNSYEPECDNLATFVRAGDLVVDIGVNMGQYSSRLRRLVGPAGRVIGFEASGATHVQSRRIVSSANVDIHRLAVGAAEGSVVLARYADQYGVTNHGISRVVADGDSRASERETVRCVALDEFLASRDRPIAFIKCDVEGYEPQVFDGARRVIATDRPVMLVEIQDSDNYRHVAGVLAPHGYSAYQLNAQRQWQPVEGYEQRWTINFLFSPDARGIS